MFYKKGKRCEVEGCCVPSKKYCNPESPIEKDENDTTYPSIWKELYSIFLLLPLSVGIFVYNIYTHLFLGLPKKPSWDIQATVSVAALHALRNLVSSSGVLGWRMLLNVPYNFSNLKQYYHPASFTVKKLGLPGILNQFDFHETGTREIEAHWLLPLKETKNDGKKIVLYLHGGGYCGKDWYSFFSITQKLSKQIKRPIFSINYRLAPETRFPGALVDAFQAYFHLITEYKISPKDIALVGDSAGGGLVLALLVYLRDHNYPLPETSVSMSPWLDLSYNHQSWTQAWKHDTLPHRPAFDAVVNPARFYLGTKQYHKLCIHPYASPLYIDNYDNLPPILIQSGDSEAMTDEVRLLAKKLSGCKNTIFKHEEYEDMIHDFQAYPFIKSEMAISNIKKWFDIKIKLSLK